MLMVWIVLSPYTYLGMLCLVGIYGATNIGVVLFGVLEGSVENSPL
jgi:carbon starvation protein CstA